MLSNQKKILLVHAARLLCDANLFRNDEKVASLGFEPKQTESKSVVLPLHHEAMWLFPSGAEKDTDLRTNDKHYFLKILTFFPIHATRVRLPVR